MLVLVSAVVLKWHRLALALALNEQLHPSPSLHPDPSPSPNPIQVLKWQRTLRLMDGLFEQVSKPSKLRLHLVWLYLLWPYLVWLHLL